MSADLSRLYSALGDDVDPTRLPAPRDLRERADRRARTVAGLALAVVVAAGTAIATAVAGQSPHPPVTQPASGPVPDEAFLVAHPTVSRGRAPSEGGAYLPFGFCEANPPTDRGVLHRRARTMEYFIPGDPVSPSGTVVQTITVYGPGAAAGQMSQFRTVVELCDDGGVRMADDGPRPPADDYLLMEVGQRPRDRTPVPTVYIAAVRVGDAISVLLVRGWDGTNADRGITDDYTDRAIAALRAWRR
jgi:hypothetical protein